MAIIGWRCPGCKQKVPLDHFQNTLCGLKCHPDYAESVLHDGDDRYVRDVVTVTNGLGCPRARAIEKDLDVFVNPMEYNALLIGRAWDQMMEKHAPEAERKIQVCGKIAGIEVFGEIDRVRRVKDIAHSYLTIEDHKHGNNFQYKFVVAEGAKREAQIQTSLYAELYAQQFGERPTHGTLWYHFSGGYKSSAPPVVSFTYLVLPLDECLAHKPYGGKFTVEELLKQANRYEKWKRGEGGIRTEALDLPLAGESMAFGTTSYCDYCQVREECFTAARGAPF